MKSIPIMLLGAGGVGRALLSQIVKGRSTVAGRNNLRFEVVAVADSRYWLYEPSGLSDEQLTELAARKRARQPIGPERPHAKEIVQQAVDDHIHGALLVDVTADAGMQPAIDLALDSGFGVVLANKKPLASAYDNAKRYFNHPHLRHESTVGGGQPVIATLRYLLDVDDTPTHIEGQMSGTLGYICRRLDEEVPLSRAIAEAKAKGYTEPDPREDLGGADVMRKALILARMCGWPLEAEQIAVESLYSNALAHLSIPEFMAASVALDRSMAERVAEARSEGNVLRYVAEVNQNGGRVGLKAVPADSALANLKYISLRTPYYDDEPLMIAGKGAGVDMTAAGVHGDMISLGREMQP